MGRQKAKAKPDGAVPLGHADRARFRNWLIPLTVQVERALQDPGDAEAQANVRTMLLNAMTALAELEQRELRLSKKRDAELRRAVLALQGAPSKPVQVPEPRRASPQPRKAKSFAADIGEGSAPRRRSERADDVAKGDQSRVLMMA